MFIIQRFAVGIQLTKKMAQKASGSKQEAENKAKKEPLTRSRKRSSRK
jgi:hypothetical protein